MLDCSLTIADTAFHLRHDFVGQFNDAMDRGGVGGGLLQQFGLGFGGGLKVAARKGIVALD